MMFLSFAPTIIHVHILYMHTQIDYVAHGEDAVVDADGNDLYQFVKETGRFCTIRRTEGVSTSGLIKRIIKNYDTYVLRNLNRGYSRDDLNVGFVKVP
jgi:choline-phosphate cytidylyltransferase